MMDCFGDMDTHYQAARLVGSAAVSDAGKAVRDDGQAVLEQIIKPDNYWSALRRGPRDDLVAAMRQDLGKVD